MCMLRYLVSRSAIGYTNRVFAVAAVLKRRYFLSHPLTAAAATDDDVTMSDAMTSSASVMLSTVAQPSGGGTHCHDTRATPQRAGEGISPLQPELLRDLRSDQRGSSQKITDWECKDKDALSGGQGLTGGTAPSWGLSGTCRSPLAVAASASPTATSFE